MKCVKVCVLLAGVSLALQVRAEEGELMKISPDISYAKTRTSSYNLYLLPEASEKLSEVQKDLKEQGFSLVVYEAYVPYSLHKKSIVMDESIPDKEECLRHSCGMAVDVGLEKADGTALSMPTAFDEFGPDARPDYMDLSGEVIEYRQILKDAMERHGFKSSPNTWYHFECVGCSTDCFFDISMIDLP